VDPHRIKNLCNLRIISPVPTADIKSTSANISQYFIQIFWTVHHTMHFFCVCVVHCYLFEILLFPVVEFSFCLYSSNFALPVPRALCSAQDAIVLIPISRCTTHSRHSERFQQLTN